MQRRLKKRVFFLVLALLAAIFGGNRLLEGSLTSPGEVSTAGKLAVSFIDVGQGDSTLIEFPGGKTALIDGGEADYGETVVDYLKERGCRQIDYLIATHPHSDHIGGLTEVVETFDIGAVYMPRVSHTSKTYERLLQAVKKQGLSVQTARAGVVLEVEPDVVMTLAGPCSDSYEELNDYSAVVHLAYREVSFLFPGDAETLSEKEMLQSGQLVEADVLKAGHHGSSTSSHRAFLEAVSPEYAVISCGEDNSYGHPHDEVMEALSAIGATVFRTDTDGTVMAVSDGKSLDFYKTEE